MRGSDALLVCALDPGANQAIREIETRELCQVRFVGNTPGICLIKSRFVVTCGMRRGALGGAPRGCPLQAESAPKGRPQGPPLRSASPPCSAPDNSCCSRLSGAHLLDAARENLRSCKSPC